MAKKKSGRGEQKYEADRGKMLDSVCVKNACKEDRVGENERKI